MGLAFVQLLLLLLAVNGAPILARNFLGSRGDLAVDFGRQLPDGYPIFGSSKTWRGIAAAIVTSCALSLLFGYGAVFGIGFGALVMVGDLASSFIKRRRGLAPSEQSLGWDQLPESLLPVTYSVFALDVNGWFVLALPAAFMLIEIVISRPLFILKIRKRPY